MPFKDTFIQSLLPGNYALTKSMELTKVNNSGTLWYTKKFLTLYYYIFLSNDIMTLEYIDLVKHDFDSFIDGLDDAVKPSAQGFFYPDNPAINFRSPNFNSFANFASYNAFANQNQRNSYYNRAKKYYFSLLMESGGQTGIKKKLKEAVQRPDFVYSSQNIDNEILSAAIQVCVEDANQYHEIKDNSVKYIVSQEAIDHICRESRLGMLSTEIAEQIIRRYPHADPKYRSVENDMVAFIRNERQILYYYGFFHSKSSGANDFEFSSLTPIGELALKANAKEFLAIWEHQKIKMISQPATADINNVPVTANPLESFAISYTPYTDILGHLLRRNQMSCEEYQYLVSRKKNTLSETEWQRAESEMCDNITEIKEIVKAFGRTRDIKTEDSLKELKKYLLGIRADLPIDAGTNCFNACKMEGAKVIVTNADTISLLYDIYTRLDRYKIAKYENVFHESEVDLRRRYSAARDGHDNVIIDPRVKIHWDLYNIHPDKLIMLSAILAIETQRIGITAINALTNEQVFDSTAVAFDSFRSLLRGIGVNSLSKFRKDLRAVINALRNNEYSEFIPAMDEEQEEVVARYREDATEDLWTRIADISAAAVVTPAEDRARNMNLVSLLKSYYIQRFAHDNVLTCECCGQETFITERGEPYLEFHHLIPFGIAYGPDHYLNLFALCPNCHRKMHFLSIPRKGEHYHLLDDNNYLRIELTERLRQLKTQNLLRSYHLEYLLADQAITEEEYTLIAA